MSDKIRDTMIERDVSLDDTLGAHVTMADVVRGDWRQSTTTTTPELAELEGLSLVNELGRGGMGVVYRAVQKALDREVAVKLLDPSNRFTKAQYERFRQEVTLAASLNHPNIAHIHWVSREAGLIYFVMEFIHGRSLAELLITHRLDLPDLAHLFGQVCDGLTHAHERGVVHRDLKPANILVEEPSVDSRSSSSFSRQSEFGRAVLVDFGLAARSGESSLNEKGMLMGTPADMSPEQANGEPTDHRTDIYSLGVALFEGLTGRVPFSGRTPLAMALMHASKEAPDPREYVPSLPTSVADLVNRMLSKSRDARPETATEVRDLLVTACSSFTTSLSFSNTPSGIPGLTSREATVLAVQIPTFLSNAADQPVTRTSFVLENWFRTVAEAIEPYGGTIVRHDASLIAVVFNWPESREEHVTEAIDALKQLLSDVNELNQAHGSQLAFTAGLEAGEVYIGQVEGVPTASCFGHALDRAITLSTVQNCGVGIIGAEFSNRIEGAIAHEPLIGVGEHLGFASRLDPAYLER